MMSFLPTLIPNSLSLRHIPGIILIGLLLLISKATTHGGDLIVLNVPLNHDIWNIRNETNNGPVLTLDLEPGSIIRRVGYQATVHAVHPAATIDPAISFYYHLSGDMDEFMDVAFTNDAVGSQRNFSQPLTVLSSLPHKSLTYWPPNQPMPDGKVKLAFLDFSFTNPFATATGKISGTLTIEYEKADPPPPQPPTIVTETRSVSVALDGNIRSVSDEANNGHAMTIPIRPGSVVRRVSYQIDTLPVFPATVIDPSLSLSYSVPGELDYGVDIYFTDEQISSARSFTQPITTIASLPYKRLDWPVGGAIPDGILKVSFLDWASANFGKTVPVGKMTGTLTVEYDFQRPYEFRITRFQRQESSVILDWESEIGVTYYVQESPDLTDWTDRTTHTATTHSSTVTISRTPFAAGKGFYRISKIPAQ